MTFLAEFSHLLPYMIAMLVSSMVGVILLRGHRSLPGRLHFGALMICVAFWAFFNLMEDGTDRLAAKIAYANLEYLFIGAVPALFFRFAVRATLDTVPRWLERPWARGAVWIIPLTVAVLVWTDPQWGLVRSNFRLGTVGSFTVLVKDYSWGFWVFTAQSYLLITGAMVLWGRFLWRQRKSAHWAVLLPYFAVFLPWVSNGLVLAGLNPWPGHDPTTPVFSVMGLILMSMLERNQFLTLLPGLHEALLETWRTPLLLFSGREQLLYFNPEAARRWGLERTHWGRSPADLIPWLPFHRDQSRPVQALADDPTSGVTWEVETRPLKERRRFVGWLLAFHDVSVFEQRVAERTEALESAYGRLSDELDHRRRTEQQLFYFSLHDPLTGLANRTQFLSRLGQAVERQRRDAGKGFAVLEFNLAGFKAVNENLGYDAGDFVLVQLAHRLRSALRNVDTAARSAADSFLVLLDEVSTFADLGEAALRLRRALEPPLDIRGTSYLPELRLGMLLGTPDYTKPEQILDDVETALRRTGVDLSEPNQVFRPEWRQERLDRIGLVEDLGKALVQGNLKLNYQPIVDLSTGTMAGVEVLTRWTHPEKGPISPARFIPLAEEEGTIKPLGLWVLREAARFFSRLERELPMTADLFLSVNVSPRQLVEADFSGIVLGILQRENLDPRRLHLEITETALVENTDRLLPSLKALRAEGIQIKLDDFGTGYSSLQSLHRLPIDTLKIDRSFVSELPQGRPILKTIVSLAAELGLGVVAEGIETADQRAVLTELGCQEGQGYHFSPGWSPADFEARISGGAGLTFVDGTGRRA